MSLELEDIKEMHDKAYDYGQTTREESSDDLVFYWITQWDDNALSESQLAYRGEFNILRKAGRQILADLEENEIQVDFEPKDDTREDSAELLDGLYRSDDNHNSTIEAYSMGKQESVVCGFGAWEICTEYSSLRSGSESQEIRRIPIPEANNTVFFDPNAKMLDKSDAEFCSVLTAYSENGYKDLVKELTGEELDKVESDSFSQPETAYVFPWIGNSGKLIYVTKFYYREKVKDNILTMSNPFGEVIQVWESVLADVMDEMLAEGYSIESSKEVERYQVTKYIASGADILSEDIIAGEHIPIVPVYGERAFIEGEEHYEGVTRLAKDPQRLRNFQLSYLADIVSRSPRQKPIFSRDQLAGYEDMYNETGSENNYAFLFQNRTDINGNPLPYGPLGVMPEQPIPTALVASINLSREAVEDVANPGTPQDIADPDLSGKAVLALQARLDMQSLVYQQHLKHAKRRDAEVYASIAAEIYDVPRKVSLTLPDGTRKTVSIMEAVIDRETGDIVTVNDIRGAEFDVFSKIGSSYNTQREQTVERLEKMMAAVEQGNPIRNILLLKTLKLVNGIDFDDIRDYANAQLILQGIKKPETPEEFKLLEDAKRMGEQPTPEMVLAQAEMMKGRADVMREQRENVKLQLTSKKDLAKLNIDTYEAKTDRIEALTDVKKAGADINLKQIDAFGKQLDNVEKMENLDLSNAVSEDELIKQIALG